jgi:hypothetical protein
MKGYYKCFHMGVNKQGQGVKMIIHFHLLPRPTMYGALPPHLLRVMVMACCLHRVSFTAYVNSKKYTQTWDKCLKISRTVTIAQTSHHVASVQYQATSCEICGGWSSSETGFSLSFFSFPLHKIITPLLHSGHPLTCAAALTRQHNITCLILNCVSSLWSSAWQVIQ